MTFLADGTFTASDLPSEEFAGFPGVLPPDFDKGQDMLPGSGKWYLLGPIGDRSGSPRARIDLTVVNLAGRLVWSGAQMRAEHQDAAIVLVFYLSDPDLKNRVAYKKCLESSSATSSTSS